MIPTLIFLGVLYASISARFVFFRVFEGTRHKGNHTVIGWASWAGILAITWVFAFVIAEAIPFFGDLLLLMSSLFDSFFGFIFLGSAYLRMRRTDYGPGWVTRRGVRGLSGFILNIAIICIGLFMLTGGTYVGFFIFSSCPFANYAARQPAKVSSIITRLALWVALLPAKATLCSRQPRSKFLVKGKTLHVSSLVMLVMFLNG